MQLHLSKNYRELSVSAATWVAATIAGIGHFPPLLCLPSGSTPEGLYQELLRMQREERLPLESWNYAGLDEWLGMGEQEEGSCQQMIRKSFLSPAGVADQQVHFFDGKTANPSQACDAMESYIRNRGGLDLAILGLGMNGHIGLNEPGASSSARTHVCDLTESTRRVGQKYFSSPKSLERGITLGLGNLMEARNLLLLVSGTHKATVFRQFLESPPTEALPATLLKTHPSLWVFADADAASGSGS